MLWVTVLYYKTLIEYFFIHRLLLRCRSLCQNIQLLLNGDDVVCYIYLRKARVTGLMQILSHHNLKNKYHIKVISIKHTSNHNNFICCIATFIDLHAYLLTRMRLS